MGAARAAVPAPGPDDEPQRRLSWSRVGLLVLVVGAVSAGTVVSVTRASDSAVTPTASWSVPYVDVTLTPTFQFQDPEVNPARTVALSFVVADPQDDCAPSWGGYYSLDAAGLDLDLDRRIAQLRSAGGDVMVSLGGQANTELAVSCTDVEDLTDAYRDLVERYDLAAVDLDVEGTAVADQAASARRAQALATVQRERAADGTPLAVWLTLPVTPAGLTSDGVATVATTIGGDLELTGVNVMTMDYGSSRPAGTSMRAATEQAVTVTVEQVAGVYAAAGTTLTDSQAWARVGATPMIGQNDVDGEVFTLDDAEALAGFARSNGLGRVSLWSINRDLPCSASFGGVAVHSNTCSGVDQQPLAFVTVFGDLGGDGPATVVTDVVQDSDRIPVVDDPATSPYPVWRADRQYPAGYKVVWRGTVYQAQWYASGIDPTVAAATGVPSPWALIGAVTTTEAAPAPVPTVDDVTALWDPTVLYARGQRVLVEGLPYEARWTNQAQAPGTLFPIGPDEAWAPLFEIPGEPVGS